MNRIWKRRVQNRFLWPLAAFGIAGVAAALLVGFAVTEPIRIARVGYIAGAVMALVIAVIGLFGIGYRNRQKPAREVLGVVGWVLFEIIFCIAVGLLAWFLR